MKRALAIIAILVSLIGTAFAENNIWVMCKTYVNIREKPSSRSEVIGRFDSGEGLETDWKRSGDWLHLIHLSCEIDEGWVYAGYIVESQPERVNDKYSVSSNGRVALRTKVDGDRRAWAKKGTELTVLWRADDWTLTTRGYIRSEYLEAGK